MLNTLDRTKKPPWECGILSGSARTNTIFRHECVMLEIWLWGWGKNFQNGVLEAHMPLEEWFGAQSIPVDRCQNKSHPTPVWTSGHWCFTHDVGITAASFTQGTHSDQSMSLLFLALRAVMASLKASAEHVPGSCSVWSSRQLEMTAWRRLSLS